MRERAFVDWIRLQGRLDAAAVPVGPGDDMAVVAIGEQRILITTDQVLDGVHVVLADHGPEAAGRKAMARGLSDVAAMAAVPLAAVAAVALPRGFARADAEAIYRGLRGLGEEYACPLVGGDVAVGDAPPAIVVTVLARPGQGPPVLRSGARAGDAVCVTGAFGGAWRSRRHLQFTPRIGEALAVAAGYRPHAMIDVSDGLAADLAHLCEASGAGAEIAAAAVPVHADAGDRGLAAALGDGEDYELIFTLDQADARRLLDRQPLGVPVTRIGTITAGPSLTLVQPDGGRGPLDIQGWEHRT